MLTGEKFVMLVTQKQYLARLAMSPVGDICQEAKIGPDDERQKMEGPLLAEQRRDQERQTVNKERCQRERPARAVEGQNAADGATQNQDDDAMVEIVSGQPEKICHRHPGDAMSSGCQAAKAVPVGNAARR